MAPKVDQYSALDKLLHKLAFSSPKIQLAAADIEQTVFSKVYDRAPAADPIFITSLPRAGTTAILTALHQLPQLASHTYRDMPFVMAPVLWGRLSGMFRKEQQLRERAHGDGLAVGYDSPEAFEEVIWRTFWPEKYGPEGIALWNAVDIREEAVTFLQDHMKKIIALRCPDRLEDGQYISKNNGNLARIDLIANLFPDARILVPVRRPVQHAASLLKQHLNFLDMQARDPFVRRYMADIGHYDFGTLHRPIEFPGLSELVEGRSPKKLSYWLAYWTAAFEFVMSRRSSVIPVSYEDICSDGTGAMKRVCERLGVPPGSMLDEIGKTFHPPRPHSVELDSGDEALRSRAEDVYAALVGADTKFR